MVRRVLLICYHFPPVAGSSGVQRSLSLAKYLHESGWAPTVLTIDPAAYVSRNESQLGEIPASVDVIRVPAFDLKKRFSLFGYYPDFLALPDRWNSWAGGAVREGMRLIREQRPDIIFSTFPIATAHLIGLRLARRSGLPWVADFRDSMTEENYPRERYRRYFLRRLERKVVHRADRVVFTAPGCLQMYADRYPDIESRRWAVIENGFDEAVFQQADARIARASAAGEAQTPGGRGRKLLLHSGLLYPEERNPTAFLDALLALKRARAGLSEELQVRFRASGHDEQIGNMVAERGLEDIVQLAPGIAYDDALAEMMTADALLLFQGGDCNHQIPAKIYEYLRVGAPILALTDPDGDTAGVLVKRGHADSVTSMTDSAAIRLHLQKFLEGTFINGSARAESVFDDSRTERVRNFARVFEDVLEHTVP